MTQIKTTYCRNCTSFCGLQIEVNDDQHMVSVKGDINHPMTKGYHCIKANSSVDLGNGLSGRLPGSLKKQKDGSFNAVDNEVAQDEIAQKVKALVGQYGARSVGLFNGTGSYFDSLSYPIMKAFLGELGTPNLFSTHTIDQSAHWVAALRLGMMASGEHRLADHETLMIVGRNVVVTHQMQMFRPGPTLAKFRKNGGNLIVVDPRASETARYATDHLAIKPGQDAVLFAGLIREILKNGWHDAEACERHMIHLEQLQQSVQQYTPEFVEGRTGISTDQLLRTAEALGKTKSTVQVGTGVCFGAHSNLAVHLAYALNYICGSFRRAGELVQAQNVVDPAPIVETAVAPNRSWETGVKCLSTDTGQMFGEFPTAAMADEILADDPQKIRALFVFGGNPVTAIGQPEKTQKAFESLELLVVIDPRMTETARLADYVISPALQYERHDLTASQMMFTSPFAQYTEPVRPVPDGSIHTGEFFWGLSKRLGLNLTYKKLFLGNDYNRTPGGKPMDMTRAPDGETLARWWCEDSLVDFDTLKAHSGGMLVDVPETRVQAAEDNGARLDLCPDDVAQELQDVAEETDSQEYPYRLTCRRVLECLNSLYRDDPATRRRHPVNYAYLSGEDLEREGLTEGDRVSIRSRAGAISARVKTDQKLRAGVISMTHQWGEPNPVLDPEGNIGSLTARLVSTAHGDVEPINRMPRQSAIEVSLQH